MSRSRALIAPLALALTVGACGDDPAGPSEEGSAADRVAISLDTLLIPAVGFERTLGATVFDALGAPIGRMDVVWGSRDPSRVHVSSAGVVQALDYGEALVVARAGEIADTALVQVFQVPEVFTIEGPDTLWTVISRDVLEVTMVDSAGVPIPMHDVPTWASSDSAVALAYAAGGIHVVRGQGSPGTAVITGTLRGVSSTYTVVVHPRPHHIYFDYDRSNLIVGDTMTIGAWVRDEAGRPIAGTAIEWRTSDESVATVSDQGLVSAIGGGNVLITAHFDTLTTRATFSVPHPSPPPGALRVSPATYASDGHGEEIRVQSFVEDGVGPPVSVPASWTSRNPAVATVGAHFATTRGDGVTWLVGEYDGRSDSVRIEVQRVPVKLSFQDVPQAYSISFTSGLGVYPLTLDRFGGSYQNAAETIWTVRDPGVAKIISTGIGAVRKGSTWVVVELEGLVDSLHATVIPEWGSDYRIDTEADLAYFEELGIEEVFGKLTIEGTSLTSLDGLETLRTVGHGPLSVQNNPQLTDMSALANLETVAGTMFVQNNPNLTVRFPSLRSAGAVWAFGNASIEGNAFATLENVTQELSFGGTGPLISFPSLRRAGSLMLHDHGPVRVDFPVLERLEGDLTILDVAETVTFSAPELWRARSLAIQGNGALTDFDLPSLAALARNLTIESNAALTRLDGLGSLTSGLRRIRIATNPVLSDVTGLRPLGDALGSDPIVWEPLEPCEIEDNPNAATQLSELIAHLESKFPGGWCAG